MRLDADPTRGTPGPNWTALVDPGERPACGADDRRSVNERTQIICRLNHPFPGGTTRVVLVLIASFLGEHEFVEILCGKFDESRQIVRIKSC